METSIPTAPATAVATPTPTPAPMPTSAPMPVATTPAPQLAEGGNTDGGGVKSFFQNLNWMEVGFSILGVSALAYVIYYYRFKVQQDKLINNELQRQIDEIRMNMQSNLKGKYKAI